MRSSVARFALFGSLAACASSGGSRPYVAPSNTTVTSQTDVRPGNPPTYVVTVTNHSSETIVVWNTSIYDCENVRDSCLPKNTNIRIAPFGSAMVARIEPQNAQASMTYNFRWSWRREQPAGSGAVTALAAADPRLSGVFRELRPPELRALAPRIARIRADRESLTIQPGGRAELDLRRVLVLDARDSILGFTRWVQYRVAHEPGLLFTPGSSSSVIVARRPARGTVEYSLLPEVQALLVKPVPDVVMSIVAAYRFEADAPTFTGRVLDSASRAPLSCVRVGVEDSSQNVVSRTRADSAGTFMLRTPTPGTYRVRVETSGWSPWSSPAIAAAAREEKRDDHLVQFSEQVLATRRPVGEAEFEPARPAAVRFEPGTARPANRGTPVIHGVDLAGSSVLPILSIATTLPTQTLWAQFAVDTAGRVDTTSISLPAGTAATVRAAIRFVLPRVRFSPAREEGRAVCELTRLQVNISPR
jgi:hypothetical protein